MHCNGTVSNVKNIGRKDFTDQTSPSASTAVQKLIVRNLNGVNINGINMHSTNGTRVSFRFITVNL